MKEKIQTLSSGKGDALVGAISVDASLDKIRDQINDAKNNSEVFAGNADEGRFIPPCLVVNPPFKAKILQDAETERASRQDTIIVIGWDEEDELEGFDSVY